MGDHALNKRRRDAYRKDRERLADLLKVLDVRMLNHLADLYENATAQPDGFPAGGSGDGSKSADSTTSTERAALSGLPDIDPDGNAYEPAQWVTNEAGQRVRTDAWNRHVRPDPIGDNVAEIMAILPECAGLARKINKLLQPIINAADGLRGPVDTMSECQACGRAATGAELPQGDRDDIGDPLNVVPGYLRSGYCDACRKSWDRQGRPDRPAFERERRKLRDGALAARDAEHSDPVLDYIGVGQDRGIMPKARDAS